MAWQRNARFVQKEGASAPSFFILLVRRRPTAGGPVRGRTAGSPDRPPKIGLRICIDGGGRMSSLGYGFQPTAKVAMAKALKVFVILLLVLFVRPHGLFGAPSADSVREH